MAFNGTPICSLHDEIRLKLQELHKLNWGSATREAQRIIRETYPLLDQAKIAGQRMEDCIVRRREALEKITKEAVNGL